MTKGGLFDVFTIIILLNFDLRGSSELDLDASFVLENARLKLVNSLSTDEKDLDQLEKEKLMHRRQSLAATASSKKALEIFLNLHSNVKIKFE